MTKWETNNGVSVLGIELEPGELVLPLLYLMPLKV